MRLLTTTTATTTTTLLALLTPTLALPEPAPAANPNFPDFPTNLNLPPPSIISLIPSSILTDPSAAASAYSSILAGSYPAWYSTLPADVKSYFSSWESASWGGSWPTGGWGDHSDWGNGWGSSAAGWQASSWSSSGWATATPTPNVTSRKVTPTLASATLATANSNPAARPTGMVAASFAGVVGVLGAAMML